MTCQLKPILIIPGILFLFSSLPSYAQFTEEYLQQFIEVITENSNGAEEFDYTELGEQLDDWIRSPLDINSTEITLLVQWKLISETAYRNLQLHIERNGLLLDVLELQSVPGFDPETIRILKSITCVGGRGTLTQAIPLGDLFLHGQNEIYVRWGRTIQESEGYIGEVPAYEGNPDKFYFKYRHRNGNALTYGITAEKDAGEAFFKGSNRQGFDYYSYHVA
ncbi:MAG TPA: hypothetical protein VGK46_14560, partial [Saprospiraceae bacterium]